MREHFIQTFLMGWKSAIQSHLFYLSFHLLFHTIASTKTFHKVKNYEGVYLFFTVMAFFIPLTILFTLFIWPTEGDTPSQKSASVLKKFVAAFIDYPKPLIAIVNGPAIGIGVTTLALCDSVFALDSVSIGLPIEHRNTGIHLLIFYRNW